MASDQDDPIDRLLLDDAAAWQATRLPKRDVDSEWFRDSQGLTGSFAWVALVLGFIAVLGFVFLRSVVPPQPQAGGPQLTDAIGAATHPVEVTPSPEPMETTAPSPTVVRSTSRPSERPTGPMQQIVGIGDRVAGMGVIIAPQAREPYLCTDPISIGTAAGCGGEMTAVPVTGIDPRSISGAERAGSWVTDYLMASGTWKGTSFEVLEVNLVEPPVEVGKLTNVPCSAPPDGWPGVLSNAAAELSDLESRLAEHPDTYTKIWYATSVEGSIDPQDVVVVVGTVGDVTQAVEDLSSVYGSNLCVAAVQRSASELDAIVAALSALDLPVQAEVDVEEDVVVVQAFVLDQQTSDAVVPYGNAVVVRTSLERAA